MNRSMIVGVGVDKSARDFAPTLRSVTIPYSTLELISLGFEIYCLFPIALRLTTNLTIKLKASTYL